MPVAVNGQTYYRTAEACIIAGTSRHTLFRWIRDGVFEDVNLRDRKGWRLFTESDIDRLKTEVNIIQEDYSIRKIDDQDIQNPYLKL